MRMTRCGRLPCLVLAAGCGSSGCRGTLTFVKGLAQLVTHQHKGLWNAMLWTTAVLHVITDTTLSVLVGERVAQLFFLEV